MKNKHLAHTDKKVVRIDLFNPYFKNNATNVLPFIPPKYHFSGLVAAMHVTETWLARRL